MFGGILTICTGGHTGLSMTNQGLTENYCRIVRDEVGYLFRHRSTCVQRQSAKLGTALAIVVNTLFGRMQVDLIDIKHDPEGEYHRIYHMFDHFSRSSMAVAIITIVKYKDSLTVPMSFANTRSGK